MLTLKFFFYSVRITEREREKKKIGGNPGNLTKTQDHKGPKKKKKKKKKIREPLYSTCQSVVPSQLSLKK